MPTVKKPGLLIAIEGIDGAGKTTQAARLTELLTEQGFEVVRSKEPTDGRWGRELRESAKLGRLPIERELELFLKDRREHVDTLVKPAIARGAIVIIDRYYFSTAAYQGARGMDPVALMEKNEKFAPVPDVLIHLDVEPRLGLSRIAHRGDEANHFEVEENLRAAAEIFRALDKPYLLRLNGAESAERITRKILDTLFSGPLSSIEAAREEWVKTKRLPLRNAEVWNRLAEAE